MAEATQQTMKFPEKLTEEEIATFHATYDVMKEYILSTCHELHMSKTIIEEIDSYYAKCLDHTCLGGKLVRGLGVVFATKCFLFESSSFDEAALNMSCIVGWCLELLQAVFLVSDDLMDSSHLRRGRPSWYCLPEIGFPSAVNDTLLMHSLVYRTLTHFTGAKPYCMRVADLLHEGTFRTTIGQHLDTRGLKIDNAEVDLELSTWERFCSIARYKTGYYTFHLPCALGMAICGVEDAELDKKLEHMGFILGDFYQAQDDYLDAYGDPKIIGKPGKDIQELKCTWLLCKALELGTPEQKAELKLHSGVDEEVSVQRVKQIYVEMGLVEMFKEYEVSEYQRILKMINEVGDQRLEAVLMSYLNRIYRRPS